MVRTVHRQFASIGSNSAWVKLTLAAVPHKTKAQASYLIWLAKSEHEYKIKLSNHSYIPSKFDAHRSNIPMFHAASWQRYRPASPWSYRNGQQFLVKRKDQSGSMIARATKFQPIKMHPQKFVDPERGRKHSFKIGAPEPTLFRVILTRKGSDICDSGKWSEFWPGIFKSIGQKLSQIVNVGNKPIYMCAQSEVCSSYSVGETAV